MHKKKHLRCYNLNKSDVLWSDRRRDSYIAKCESVCEGVCAFMIYIAACAAKNVCFYFVGQCWLNISLFMLPGAEDNFSRISSDKQANINSLKDLVGTLVRLSHS